MWGKTKLMITAGEGKGKAASSKETRAGREGLELSIRKVPPPDTMCEGLSPTCKPLQGGEVLVSVEQAC